MCEKEKNTTVGDIMEAVITEYKHIENSRVEVKQRVLNKIEVHC